MDNKDKKTAQIFGLAGALVAAMLLVRKKVGAAMGAAVSIRVLDALGNEIPHNSPVDLEAGESYTVQITVTNQSTQQGQPAAVALTSSIGAMVVGEPPLISDTRTDDFPAGGPLTFTYPLQVPDYAFTGGQIRAIIFDLPPEDPNHQQLAVATLDFNGVQARRAAVNGMGDLDNDGYVTMADADIVKAYYFGSPFAGFDISDISPLSIWEFVRRADLHCDANINANDIIAIEKFIFYGTLPTPAIGKRAAINGMGDLNDDGYVSSVDIMLCGILMGGAYTPSQISPLSEAELLRRADLNGDGEIDILDIMAINNFINTGQLPQPAPIVYAASVDVTI